MPTTTTKSRLTIASVALGLSLALGACGASTDAADSEQESGTDTEQSGSDQGQSDAGSDSEDGAGDSESGSGTGSDDSGDTGSDPDSGSSSDDGSGSDDGSDSDSESGSGSGESAAASDELCGLLAEGSTVDPSDPQGAVEVFNRIEEVAPATIATEIAAIREAYESLVDDPQADYGDVFGPEVVGAGMALVAWESELCSQSMVEVTRDHIDSAREAAAGSSWDDAIVGTSIVNGRAAISMWEDSSDADAMAACEAIIAEAPGGSVAVYIGDRKVAASNGSGCG